MNLDQFIDNPINLIMIGILVAVFILLYVFIIRRARRVAPEQREAANRTEKFRFSIFIPLVILFGLVWAGTSAYYEDLSGSSTEGAGRCDICGLRILQRATQAFLDFTRF